MSPSLAATGASPFRLANPAGLYDPSVHGYSHVAAVDASARIVHLAGQGGYDAHGALAPDFAAQTRQAIDNVRLALASEGARLQDVFKLTLLVVDHDASRLADWVSEARRAWGGAYPTCTLIPVPRLAIEGMLVELEAIAATP